MNRILFLKLKSKLPGLLIAGMLMSSAFALAQDHQQNEVPQLKMESNLSVSPMQNRGDVLPPEMDKASEVASNVVGEGDQLMITVFGQPDLSADVTVGASGVITLPLVGAIEVKGKTSNEIAVIFSNKLEQGQYLIQPKVAVRIGQQVSRSFSVLGEVLKPGRFPIQGQMSIFDALSQAGGISSRADKTLRLLRRKDTANQTEALAYETIRLDFEDAKTTGQLMQKVLPNDVLIVGQQKNFYVYGEVRRPGAYPVEDDLNVMRVLSIGGGMTDKGSSSRMIIHRKTQSGELKEIPAHLSDPVLPGDVVFINERIF